jgi:DNA-binding transcriptional regulator YbjK
MSTAIHDIARTYTNQDKDPQLQHLLQWWASSANTTYTNKIFQTNVNKVTIEFPGICRNDSRFHVS